MSDLAHGLDFFARVAAANMLLAVVRIGHGVRPRGHTKGQSCAGPLPSSAKLLSN